MCGPRNKLILLSVTSLLAFAAAELGANSLGPSPFGGGLGAQYGLQTGYPSGYGYGAYGGYGAGFPQLIGPGGPGGSSSAGSRAITAQAGQVQNQKEKLILLQADAKALVEANQAVAEMQQELDSEGGPSPEQRGPSPEQQEKRREFAQLVRQRDALADRITMQLRSDPVGMQELLGPDVPLDAKKWTPSDMDRFPRAQTIIGGKEAQIQDQLNDNESQLKQQAAFATAQMLGGLALQSAPLIGELLKDKPKQSDSSSIPPMPDAEPVDYSAFLPDETDRSSRPRKRKSRLDNLESASADEAEAAIPATVQVNWYNDSGAAKSLTPATAVSPQPVVTPALTSAAFCTQSLTGPAAIEKTLSHVAEIEVVNRRQSPTDNRRQFPLKGTDPFLH